MHSNITCTAGANDVERDLQYRAAAWSAYKTLTSNKDNSQLQDNMLNQTLTTEQIEAMKEANMGGDEIVTALLANSGTFETKTEYSQVATLLPLPPQHAHVKTKAQESLEGP